MYRQASIGVLNGNPLLRARTVSHILLNVTTRFGYTTRNIKHQTGTGVFES